MRFYIDGEAKINCIYQKLQFDYSQSGYVNKSVIAYPSTYKGMSKDKVSKYIKCGEDFCFNPQIECEGKNAKEIAKEFVEFIKSAESVRKALVKENKIKGELYIVRKAAIDSRLSNLLKLNRQSHCLELYRKASDNSVLHNYYPIREDFDSFDYLMYEKEKEFPCIWGGGDTLTPEGIFQIEKVSEKHEEYISGYHPEHEKVKFFGYLVVFEDYFIHSNLYVDKVTKDKFEQEEPINKTDEHTSGCIRVSQEDLDWLVEHIEAGTTIVM